MLPEEDESFYFKSNTTFNHGASVPFNSIFPIVCWGNEVRLSFFLLSSSSSVWKKKKKTFPKFKKDLLSILHPFSLLPKRKQVPKYFSQELDSNGCSITYWLIKSLIMWRKQFNLKSGETNTYSHRVILKVHEIVS